MRVLIVDNNIMQDSWGAKDLRRMASLIPEATVYVRRAPQEDLPHDLTKFDRMIVSGSVTSVLDEAHWIDRLDEAVRNFINQGKPYLGVCYGHQTLARALSGRNYTRKAPVGGEFGWTEIEQLQDSKLLNGLPKKFHSWSRHYEEVAPLPPGMKLLAKSNDCEIQACQLESKPVFGIQFHPEKTFEDGESQMVKWLERGEPKNLLHPRDGKKVFDAKVGDIIFRNFLSL